MKQKNKTTQEQQLLATLKAAKVIDSSAGIQYAKVLAKSMKKIKS